MSEAYLKGYEMRKFPVDNPPKSKKWEKTPALVTKKGKPTMRYYRRKLHWWERPFQPEDPNANG